MPHESDQLICQQTPFVGEACLGLQFFREDEEDGGRRYCVLHYPADDKVAEFDRAVQNKLQANDFNFHSVRFPSETKVNFVGVAFTSAIFSAAAFRGMADFSGASFEDTADFGGVAFEAGASFSSATFKSTADFRYAKVRGQLDFTYATFTTYLDLEGAASPDAADNLVNPVFEEGASLKLYLSHIEMPERVSFRTLRLEPRWFISIDPRRFEFVNVKWDEEPMRDAVKGLLYARPYPLLSLAYRQLATNAEENHRLDEASKLRYGAMEARRLETLGGCGAWRLNWWYWLLSGYSERVGRAAVVLFLLLALFAAAYTRTTFLRREGPAIMGPTEVALDLKTAAVYSLECALLQRPEPKPATPSGRALVALETVLGPLQGALLALAVRRKFMG